MVCYTQMPTPTTVYWVHNAQHTAKYASSLSFACSLVNSQCMLCRCFPPFAARLTCRQGSVYWILQGTQQ